jgi:replicative DNA helicase
LRDPTSDAPPQPQPENLPRLYQLDQLLGDWQTDAQAAHTARVEGTPRGPLTGLPKLDRELNGALAPGVHIVHGDPGTGKTAFVLQAAAKCECPALLVTTEMAPLELLKRHTARVTETFLGRLKSGELSPDHSLGLARKAIAAAPNLKILDATRAYVSYRYLLDCAQAVKGNARHVLILIDSVHTWAESSPAKGSTEYDALNEHLAALRKLAHELNCPVLGVAERNRAGMERGGQSASAGTRKFEYGAETVLDLHRDKDARENGAGEVIVTAKFAKNRHGAAGRAVTLLFNGALQRFTEDSL